MKKITKFGVKFPINKSNYFSQFEFELYHNFIESFMNKYFCSTEQLSKLNH